MSSAGQVLGVYIIYSMRSLLFCGRQGAGADDPCLGLRVNASGH